MTTIYVDGKPIEVEDESVINRPPPSRDYEPIQADFFDVESMVEASKNSWINARVQDLMKSTDISEEEARAEVGGLPPGVEEVLRDKVVDIINETIEVELEKTELYRDYTQKGCQKLIDKYEDILLNKIIVCREIGRRMKQYAFLLELDTNDPAVREVHQKEIDELEALYNEWATEDLKRQKYQIFVEDFKAMHQLATE